MTDLDALRAIAAVSPTGTKYPDRLAAEYARLATPSADTEQAREVRVPDLGDVEMRPGRSPDTAAR